MTHTKPVTTLCRLTLAACALLAAGCGGGGNSGSGSGSTGTVSSALVGSYGGAQTPLPGAPAALVLTATGGTLTLPCGEGGVLSAPLVPDGTGHATAAGTFTAESGPVKVGGSAPVAATYAATVAGSQVTLVVTTTGSASPAVTTFTLALGQTVDFTDYPCPS